MEKMMMSKPKKWWEVYANDDEKKFFVGKDGHSGLARKNDFQWRTTEAIARESGLTKSRVEQLIDKYHKRDIVIKHPKDPEKWGYWENVNANVTKKDSIKDEDQKNRIDKAKKKI
jgi:hypothetical protein